MRILELIHEALISKVVVSKRFVAELSLALMRLLLCNDAEFNFVRNIYYKDPSLFKKQAVVDRYVDILAFTFGVQRADLNVVSLQHRTM